MDARFSCRACAAAPQLQDMNGCHTEKPFAVAAYAGEEYRRCPRQHFGPDEEEVLAMHEDGYLRGIGPRERRLLPHMLAEALAHVARLRGEEEGDGRRG